MKILNSFFKKKPIITNQELPTEIYLLLDWMYDIRDEYRVILFTADRDDIKELNRLKTTYLRVKRVGLKMYSRKYKGEVPKRFMEGW